MSDDTQSWRPDDEPEPTGPQDPPGAFETPEDATRAWASGDATGAVPTAGDPEPRTPPLGTQAQVPAPDATTVLPAAGAAGYAATGAQHTLPPAYGEPAYEEPKRGNGIVIAAVIIIVVAIIAVIAILAAAGDDDDQQDQPDITTVSSLPSTVPPSSGPSTPSTEAPTTVPPTTEAPTTAPPTTAPPTTAPPTTAPPSTATVPPATEPPVTEPPVTEPPTSVAGA